MQIDMNEIIRKKRDGGVLSADQIRAVIRAYTDDQIPDYQMAALLMAIYFRHLTKEGTFALTDAMKESGQKVDLSAIHGRKVDKHSTGGVGDKMTLIVSPIAAAAGVPIAKMSGRALGFTGGTLDKLEAIPGFTTQLSAAHFVRQVNDIGFALMGQSGQIAPADKKIYALRDVTGTVEEMSLIASSIMSKKLAAGADAILLDVKCGRGAFMKSVAEAKELASLMCAIGQAARKQTVAEITDMNQPLGFAVGNSIEVIEAVETLKGRGPADVTELAVKEAGTMIFLGALAPSPDVGEKMAAEAIEDGRALAKFQEFVTCQGGADITEDYTIFPQARIRETVYATRSGFVQELDAEPVGRASQHTGAGRQRKEDAIDPSAGILLLKKRGQAVTEGEPLARVLSSSEERAKKAAEEVQAAYVIGREKPKKRPILIGRIGL